MTLGESERLENIQRSAIRVICGAKVGTSHLPLYNEVRLDRLAERRNCAILIKFWEIQKCTQELRLNRQMLTTVAERNPLARRRMEDFSLIKCNTSQYQRSFLPSAVRLWNSLQLDTRASQSRQELKAKLQPRRTPMFAASIEVTRWSSILLSRLRCGNPDLNHNLFSRLMKDDPSCACGAPQETIKHYLFDCSLYSEARSKIINSHNYLYFNINTIMHGCELLTGADDDDFQTAVQNFIIDTRRF